MRKEKNIISNTLFTLISQIAAHLFGIIAGVFITRTLGTIGRGEYAIFYANINFFCALFGASVTSSIVYFVSSKKMAIEKVISLTAIVLILTTLLSIIFICLSFIPSLKHLLIPEMKWNLEMILLFILSIFITQLNAAFTSYFQGIKEFRTVNRILIFNSVANLIVFTLLFLLHQSKHIQIGLDDIIICSIFILIMNSILWIQQIKKKTDLKFSKSLSKIDYKKFFYFTGYNHISEVCKFFNQRTILWFVLIYSSKSDVGIFSIGLGVTSLFTIISIPISQVLETYIYDTTELQRKELFTRFSRLQFNLLLITSLLGVFVITPLVPIAYGEDFTISFSIISVLIIGVVFSCQSSIFSKYFIATQRLKINIISSLISVTSLVLSGIYFIPKYGLLGAAITQTVSYFSSFCFQYIILINSEKLFLELFWLKMNDWKFVKNQLKEIGL